MITMVDEMYDRQFQAGRTQMNLAVVGGIKRLAKGAAQAFAVLHRIEWNAPWAAPAEPAKRARSH